MEQFYFPGFGGLNLFGWYRPAEKPAAVLMIVHGIGEHSLRYAGMAEYFAGRGISVMSWDLRGHGRSEGKRGLVLNWEEFREDTRAACNDVYRRSQDRPLYIFGHSLGGTITLDFVQSAVPAPAGLIVSAPALGTPGISPVLLFIAGILSSVTPRLIMNTGLDSDLLSRDEQECRKYREDPLVHGKACVRLSTELESAQNRIFAGSGEMNLPLLLSCGSADRIAPGEPVKKYFSLAGSHDKTLRVFEGAFHEMHNDTIRSQVYIEYSDWILKRASR
jgi:alpha-beta hydrolase superfamily lysophospholipase